MRRPPVVVVAGHVTHDRRATRTAAGGPAYYAARTHRGLGAVTRLVSAVGADFACDGELAAIQTELRRGGATTELAGARLAARAEPVLAVDLPEAWRRCDLLHVAPALSEVDLARWTQVTTARVVAIGVHGFTRAPAPGQTIATRPWCVDTRVLAAVDVACVTEVDLAAQGDLLDRLARAVPVVAVALGARGCDVIVRGRTHRVGPYPGAPPVDSTGADDTFAAALAHGIARGLAPVEAAQLGAAAASIAIEAEAGDALGRIEDAWARAARVPVARDPAWIAPLISLAT
jgi:sugar/nucleoside kinase (ribokinase family)